jgi:hypothetical protein
VSGAFPNLNTREALALEQFVTEFKDVFATKSGDYRRTDKVYHWDDTADFHPVFQPPRRLHLAKQAEVNGVLEDMKERGVMEESDSPSSSPVVVVWKRNRDRRFCVRYRRLNDVTAQQAEVPVGA